MIRIRRYAAFLLALALTVCLAPCATALSALSGAEIDGDMAEKTVGETIRSRADAARDARSYESISRLRVGMTTESCAYLEDKAGQPAGLDADILVSLLESLGYRSARWFEEEYLPGLSEEERVDEDALLSENGFRLYELVLVPQGTLLQALAAEKIDLAAGEESLFTGDEALSVSKPYYSGRRTVKTHDGDERDYTGLSFALAGRSGSGSLIDGLNLKIDAQSADGTLDVYEAEYFSSSLFARAVAAVKRFARSVALEFERNLIREDRYKMLLRGLGTTLRIAAVACVFGVGLGACVALMRLSNVRIGRWKVLQWIATRYVNIVRGTPVVVQLMIIYYIVLSAPSKTFAAMMTFSLNSAAYVSEMVRGGILAVDKGQTEAGRSLGLSSASTMLLIVLPQTIKIIIPSLFNEFIMLLKETSVVGFIGLMDLSKAGDFIRSRTYSAFFPLIAVALIYLLMVTILTKVFGRLERRLRQSDIR